MKKILPFLIILLATNSCKYFEDCDYMRYQIREKTQIDKFTCHYKAVSWGECLVWNDMKSIEFTDSCKVYGLSQLVLRDELYKKYHK